MSNNSSNVVELVDGYGLAIYGLDDGSFYVLHIIAIACLSVSVICALITFTASVIIKRSLNFFRGWHKRDRFVIYMAICDGLYGAAHLADHINVFIVKDHVYPKELCVFYGFIVFPTIIAQNLLVNVIAVNAFALMYFGYNLNFGKWDWRLLFWIFGVPLICDIVATALNKLGPTGAYCLFDGVNGSTFYFAFVSIPIIVILPTNATLYILIWAKLYTQIKAVKKTVGQMSAGMKAAHKAARAMALFIAAYIVQWWSAVLYGFWAAIAHGMPEVIVQLVVFFANIGGLLNLIVFLIIQRKSESNQRQAASSITDGNTQSENLS